LKQAWGALAYADAGEFLPYAQKCKVLGVEPPAGCTGYLPPREPAPRRSVALNLGRRLDDAAVGYAIGAAQRLEAGLILLRQPDGASEPAVAAAKARIEAAGLPWNEEPLAAPWIDGVTAFLRRRPSVACLVVGPNDFDPRGLPPARGLGKRWAFPAPLVVVQGDAPVPQPA